MIGILGGMGPLATADFFSKVIAATPAAQDSDHVPLMIQSDPRIPARPAAILAQGPSPLAALLAGRDRLIAAGAVALAMPCNTAHYWYADLARNCPVPFISMVQACCNEVQAMAAPGDTIGIIATRATLAAQLFDAPLEALGYRVLTPSAGDLDSLILPAISLVKAGQASHAGALVEQAVHNLLLLGAKAIILACTETPLALDAAQSPLRLQCVDSNAALARSCVAWWAAHSGSQSS